jgi:DMSO/TMAO reductase YedYZ molybdopterin-dependent catalytic subunit
MEGDVMLERRWKEIVCAGALVGLVASVIMTLVMVLLRHGLGVATPAELVGDRLAPTLSIQEFFQLLERFGGYNELKQVGVVSVLIGQLVVGTLGGILYVFIVGHERAGTPDQGQLGGRTTKGWLFVVLFVVALWLTTLVVLWPVLGTHYAGLPSTWATVSTVVGLLTSYSAYGLTLVGGYRLMVGSLSRRTLPVPAHTSGRRAVLLAGVGVVAAAATGELLRRLYARATFSYDGLRYQGPDIQPITPNDRFYLVSKNVVDPLISPAAWRLAVTGLVERPHMYRYEDLLALPAVTQETTLECISNDIGDGLMSNALWKGVPMRHLLAAAQPRQGAVEVLLHAADGYTDTLPLDKAMDPTTLVVYEMNGIPLPERHGYPARVIVPGLFGKNNVKWVTRIDLVDADVRGFYEKQGWGPSFVVPTTSRFDYPLPGQSLRPAPGETVALKGIAYAGARGVTRVEVSLDNAQSWHEARIDYTGAPMAWVLWRYHWPSPPPKEYTLVVRATDGTGELQTPEYRSFAPQGATGYHVISVRVDV